MSTDFTVICNKCKQYHHLGQRMSTIYSFGYGSNDIEGTQSVLRFIESHIYENKLKIVITDNIPKGYADAEL